MPTQYVSNASLEMQVLELRTQAQQLQAQANALQDTIDQEEARELLDTLVHVWRRRFRWIDQDNSRNEHGLTISEQLLAFIHRINDIADRDYVSLREALHGMSVTNPASLLSEAFEPLP